MVKVNTEYTISFTVTDNNGNRVNNDNPVAVIEHKGVNKFWNGIDWQDERFDIILKHFLDGVYNYSFFPNLTGDIDIKCSSVANAITSETVINVESDDISSSPWTLGDLYSIEVPILNEYETASIKVYRESDRKYFNNTDWVSDFTMLSMDTFNNDFIYSISPDVISMYNIEIITSMGRHFSFSLNVMQIAVSVDTVFISSSVPLDENIETLEIIDNYGYPIIGAIIECYQITGPIKKLIGKTLSDKSGNWNMVVPKGKCYFMFKKEGYISKGIERVI